jgi:predicted nucleic acid-binding protein
MKTIFLDTNIIIDFLADRKPFSEDAARLFDLSLKGKCKIFVSALSYNNIYYIIRRQISHKESIKMLLTLHGWTEMIDASKDMVVKSLQSDFYDFEDAIQYHTAISNKNIECIVTRNTKDYKKSKLPVMTPSEVLSGY